MTPVKLRPKLSKRDRLGMVRYLERLRARGVTRVRIGTFLGVNAVFTGGRKTHTIAQAIRYYQEAK